MYRIIPYTVCTAMCMLIVFGLCVPVTSAQVVDVDEDQRTVLVSGEGIVRVVPDQAVVRFGIVTQAQDPEEARRLNAEAAAQVLNALRELGIDEEQLQLELLQLQPLRDYNPQTREYIDRGYEATRIVSAEVDDLDLLPTVVATAVQEGANRLEGITYDLADRDQVSDQALREALLKARDKAELLVSVLEEELGPVLSIQEQSFDFPRPFVRMEQLSLGVAKSVAEAEPDAFAAGEIEVRAVVQVVFALD